VTISTRIDKLSAAIDPPDCWGTERVVEQRFAEPGSAAKRLDYFEEAWHWIHDRPDDDVGKVLDEENEMVEGLQIQIWQQRRDGKPDYVKLIVEKAERDFAEEQGVEPTAKEFEYFHTSRWPHFRADFLADELRYAEWLAANP
jgi:hypothetical protein